jgi:hypothetical protein
MGWMHNTDHRLDLMYMLRDHAQSLAVLADLVETVNGSRRKYQYDSLRVVAGENSGELELPLEWFKVHASHHIEIFDEYGDRMGDCNKSVGCKACGHQDHCQIKRGHEGPCLPRGPR